MLEADFASRPIEMAQGKGQSDNNPYGSSPYRSKVHIHNKLYLRVYRAVDRVVKTAGHNRDFKMKNTEVIVNRKVCIQRIETAATQQLDESFHSSPLMFISF